MSAAKGVEWRDWSPTAFDEARQKDKPILLRLSAVWCHWCHVMDNTSDKVPEAIRLLNERYVPIRVDIDKMPDVRERYNFGGYPTSAFLTPDGRILTGGTYIPPEQFVNLLQRVAETYKERKTQVLQQLDEHEREHAPAAAAPAPAGGLDELARTIHESVAESILLNFDTQYGGFGTAPKFPQNGPIELALQTFLDTEERPYEVVVRKTLEAMRGGAVWDAEEGGFFRYSVTANWSEPHFEKMLETNAGLLSNYARAGGALGRADFLKTARDQRTYLERVLRDPKSGLFYGSQDADEEYYQATSEQRKRHRAPYVDPTCYADWNAQMIQAYFDAFLAAADASWYHEAIRSLDAVVERMYRPQHGILHYVDRGPPQGEGFLTDQVHTIRALLTAHDLSGVPRYLDVARDAYGFARRTMWDESQKVFLDKAALPQDLGLLRQPQSSIIDNGVMARNLVRLNRLDGQETYHKDLDALLLGHGLMFERYGIFSAQLALACLERLREPLQANVVATPEEAAAFLKEIQRIRHPYVLVRRFDRNAGAAAAKKWGIDRVSAPAAFFCVKRACSRLYRPGEPFASDVLRMVQPPVRTT